jgi:DNA-binding GntR family transcriptional regulator
MSEKLFAMISAAIIEGEFPAGASMTEPDLAKRYGVSRAPLREALRRLEERQLLERSPYRGMRVVEPSARMIRELYEIRGVLEGLACRRAATLVTDDDIARIRRSLAEERRRIAARPATPAPPSGTSPLLNVHTLIAEISGNRELLNLLNREIWRLLRADYRRRMHEAGAQRQGHRDHLQILKALAARDADLAELLMRRHVANTCRLREIALAKAAPAERSSVGAE